MRTQTTRPRPARQDDLLVAEEVILIAGKPVQTKRVLLPFALAFAANAQQARVPFQLRRLDATELASFDGDQLTARPEIVAVLPSLADFLDRLSEELTRQLLASLSPSTPSQFDGAPPREEPRAGDQGIVTGAMSTTATGVPAGERNQRG